MKGFGATFFVGWVLGGLISIFFFGVLAFESVFHSCVVFTVSFVSK